MIHESIVENKSVLGMRTVKKQESCRYFIELHVSVAPNKPRIFIDEQRRKKAYEFVQVMGEWIKDKRLESDVSHLSVTALGQVMIVCTRNVIDLIRQQDVWAIAHIRTSEQFEQLMRRH